MYTITFYSFKGGVGRTLALVNVGAQLAKMGRKVMLVDFDLEAPGLETFDRLRPGPPTPRQDITIEARKHVTFGVTVPYTAASHPGLVEYVTEYMRTSCAPDVRNYVYSAGSVGKKGGQLWVMPAGRRDAEYQSALAKINWLELYAKHDGFLLFEDTKAQWEQEFKPDYVLIDSRTGHSDVEGICTRQLPDAVAVFFFPNEQNLLGIQDVCKRISDEELSGLKKSIHLHHVMSNVPDLDDEDGILRRLQREFEWELNAVIHRYESAMLFNQAIFVLDRPKSRLAREYRRLVRTLIAANPADRDGALLSLIRYERALRRGMATESRESRAVAHLALIGFDLLPGYVRDPLVEIPRNFPDDAEILTQVDRCRVAKKRLAEHCRQVAPDSPPQQG